ncbi:hypothetical protein JCM16303_003444 [Sporobolomyces ruberrimus]
MIRASSPSSTRSNSLVISPGRAADEPLPYSPSPSSIPWRSSRSLATSSSSGGLTYRAPTSGPPSPAPSGSPVSSRSSRVPSPALSRTDISSLSRKLSNLSLPPTPAQSRPGSATSFHRSATPPRNQPVSCPGLEVFGDSFCSVFTLLGHNVRVNKYKGASAKGLNNPESALQVGVEILRRIEHSRPRFILLQFGAVDLHINYLWQLKERGTAASGPSEFINTVATEFCAYVEQRIVPEAQATGMKVYIAAVLPPVVEDHYLEHSASKYLRHSTTRPLPPLSSCHQPYDLFTRRSLVKLYNQLVSQFCARHPDCLSFVNINKHLGSSSLSSVGEPERVSREFIDNQDPTNIHLIWERTIEFWCREIPILRPFLPTLSYKVDQLEVGLKVYEKEKRERMEKRHWIF